MGKRGGAKGRCTASPSKDAGADPLTRSSPVRIIEPSSAQPDDLLEESSLMLPREYPNLYIDGRWQEPDSKERFDVISPATGERIGFRAAAQPTDLDRAVEAARKAFYETDWPTRPVEERAEMMERLAALIAEHQPEFRDLIVDELGHTQLNAAVYHSGAPTLHWNYYAD